MRRTRLQEVGKFLRSPAGITLAIGTGLALLLPALLTQFSWGLVVFNAATGAIGDTIGGIAGPVLNLTGLVIVYFSLREQFRANEIQQKALKKEKRRTRNERAFDLAVKMAEEAGAYFKANRKKFRKLLDEDRAVSVIVPPEAFASDYHDTNDLQRLASKLRDLQRGAAFFSVCEQVAPQLSTDQARIVINLFNLYYFAPLRSLSHESPEEWTHACHEYAKRYKVWPHSDTDKEIKRQRDLFKAFVKPLQPARPTEPPAAAPPQQP